MFQQPSVAIARTTVNGTTKVSPALPIILHRTPAGIQARVVPRSFTQHGRAPSIYNPAQRVMRADEHLVHITLGYVRPIATEDPDDPALYDPVPDHELQIELAPDGTHLREVKR